MSSQRSSSGQGIRELRARFENRDDQGLAPSRRQSPSDDIANNSTSKSPVGRRTIRTSFVAVEPGHPPLTMALNGVTTTESASGIADRRQSSSEQDQNVVDELKKTVSTEAERRRSIPGMEDKAVPATAVTSAMPTPIIEATEPESPALRKVTIPTREKQSEHTEKKVSAVEDEGAVLRPADVKSADAVSRQVKQGHGPNKNIKPSSKSTTRPVAPNKTSRMSAASAVATSKPSISATARPSTTHTGATRAPNGISTTTSGTAASSSRAAPASTEVKPKPKPPTQTAPLPSHLTAPTASSKAKHEPEQAKGRRVTSGGKPIETSSHLMAPTAASRAKHDSESSSSSSAGIAATVARKTPAPVLKRDRTSTAPITNGGPSRKPAARTSLTSRANGTSIRQPDAKPATAAAPGFLDRMTKPTTASLSKTHEKVEDPAEANMPKQPSPRSRTHEVNVKPAGPKHTDSKPPVQRPAPVIASRKPQANGHISKPTPSTSSPNDALPSTTAEHPALPPKAPTEEAAQPLTPIAPSKAAAKTQLPSTPVQNAVSTNDGQQDREWNAAALPLTPQSQKKNPMEPASEEAITNGTTTLKSSAAANTRRSLMETPDLAGKTIH